MSQTHVCPICLRDVSLYPTSDVTSRPRTAEVKVPEVSAVDVMVPSGSTERILRRERLRLYGPRVQKQTCVCLQQEEGNS